MIGSAPDLDRPPDQRLFHIAEPGDWTTAVSADAPYRTPSLHSEGFIHLSAGHQVLASTDRFYAGRNGLLLLTLDGAALAERDLRWETAPHGEDFPHLYEPLPLDVVTATHPWPAA